MPARAVGLALLIFLADVTPASADGVLIDARTRQPIAGAEVTIVGQRGSERTDARGRFRWDPAVPPPLVVIVILPNGRVARPIEITRSDAVDGITLVAESAVSEALTVAGAAPTIDVNPGASSTWLSGARIELERPATLSQALQHVPGVGAIAEGQGAVPAVRGLARGRTLILLNDSRVSTERRAGPNASFLDPSAIRDVEVARGPGSVAYGSDAFGGVIAVHTRRPDYAKAFGARLTASIGAGVPAENAALELSTGYGSGGVLASAHTRHADDYRSPDGAVPNSAWRDAGGMLAWEHGTGASRWTASWQGDFGRAIGRPRSDSNTLLASSPFENMHRVTASFDRTAFAGFRNVRVTGLSAWVSDRTQQERLPTSRTPRSIDRSDQSFRDLHLRLVGDRTLGPVRLQVGADVLGRYGLQAVDTTLTFNTADVVASTATSVSVASARRTGLGAFAQADTALSRRIRLTGGLRTDTVRNTTAGGYFGSRSVSNGAVAGLGAITFVPFDSLSLTAQIARGFRDPTLTDRFYRGPSGRGFIEGNPELRPETSRQIDLSARYATSRLRVAGALYDYRITNLIERYVVGTTNFYYQNRGVAQLQGVETEAQFDLAHGFALEGSAHVSHGRDAGDHTPIDDIAPDAFSTALRYSVRDRLGAYLRAGRVAAHDKAGPSEVATPGYTTVDCGASWRVGKNLEVRGAARNLLDERFYSSAGPRWVYGPGRHGSVTLVVTY